MSIFYIESFKYNVLLIIKYVYLGKILDAGLLLLTKYFSFQCLIYSNYKLGVLLPQDDRVYKTVRKVLDCDGWYYMCTEYLECRWCGKKLTAFFLSWSRGT